MADYLRLVRPDQLQTPTHSYRHPGSGQQVTVIGAMHVGEAAYFARLRAVIDDLFTAGAAVHCEGSRLLAYSLADVTDAEHQVLRALRGCRELELRRIGELGWIGQVAGLGYPPDWRIVDLTELQIVRLVGVEATARLVRRMRKRLDWDETDTNGINRFRLATTVSLRAMASPRGMDAYLKAEPANTVLLGARTSTALDGVSATDQDVVLVWGAMHLPGIEAGLTARGFVRTGEPAWFTAVQLPSIPGAVWRALVGESRRNAAAADNPGR